MICKNNKSDLNMSEKKFTVLQQKFINEAPNHSDLTKAYVAAGGSAKTASASVTRLMKIPAIKEAVESKNKKAIEKANITTYMIVEELKRMAFFRPEELVKINPETGLPETRVDADNLDKLAGVTAVNVVMGQVRFKEDKLKALELLGKYQGMFDKDEDAERNLSVTINYVKTKNPDRRTAKDVIT